MAGKKLCDTYDIDIVNRMTGQILRHFQSEWEKHPGCLDQNIMLEETAADLIEKLARIFNSWQEAKSDESEIPRGRTH